MLSGAFIDTILAFLAMLVAIAGLYLDELRETPGGRKPEPKGKGVLKALVIVFAVALFIASAVKAHFDEKEKDFLKLALESSLSPSNADYKALQSDVANHFDKDKHPLVVLDAWRCYHDQGMACFLSSTVNPVNHATLVLNAKDITNMYVNEIAKRPNDEDIQKVCDTHYDPQKFEEDFKDKVSILASVVFWHMYHKWPTSDYDDDIGVRIQYVDSGVSKELFFTPDELKKFDEDRSCVRFYRIEQHIRERYTKVVPIKPTPFS